MKIKKLVIILVLLGVFPLANVQTATLSYKVNIGDQQTFKVTGLVDHYRNASKWTLTLENSTRKVLYINIGSIISFKVCKIDLTAVEVYETVDGETSKCDTNLGIIMSICF